MKGNKIAKLRQWLRLGATRPSEAWDRLTTVLDVKRDDVFRSDPRYETVPADAVMQRLAPDAQRLTAWLGEARQIEARVREGPAFGDGDGPIDPSHSADLTLARTCYVACRLLRPGTVVETGVAYGVTSTFLLEALAANGTGRLHSVDLPPLGPDVEDHVGACVPDGIRAPWTLHRGTARRLLPGIVADAGGVDLFVHDSLHTYRNIAFELGAVTPRLARPSVVIADDVHGNAAFRHWVEASRPSYAAVVREEHKSSLFGVALFEDASTGE